MTVLESVCGGYLFEHDERAYGQGSEQSSDQQHGDAHRDAGVEPCQSCYPATATQENTC